MYGVFVNKVISGKYIDDEAESFTQVIEFDNKEELKNGFWQIEIFINLKFSN